MISKLSKFVIIISAICLFSGRPSEAAKIKVDMNYFVIKYSRTIGKLRIASGSLWDIPIEPRSVWEVKEVSPTIIHIRIPDPSGAFLKLDMNHKQIYVITGGTFGKEGGSEKLLKTAKILSNDPSIPVQLSLIQVRLESPELVFDTENVSVIYEGLKLMGPEDIEVIRQEAGVYHFRLRAEQDASVRVYKQKMQQSSGLPASQIDRFWKIDFNSKGLLKVIGGVFGERGGTEVVSGQKVTFDTESNSMASQIHDDLGMFGIQRDAIRESSWISVERELFRDVLGKQQFDVLIVPFEVQDYAFDYIERSIMTRYLYQRLKMTTDLKIPDPELIDRALGHKYRTFPIQRIYDLANELGVKTLIRGYAGHNRNMKMRVTIVVQERPEHGGFDTETKARELIFKDLVFSDEKLPSDVFADVIPNISSAIGINQTRKETFADETSLQKVSFPPTPLYLVQDGERSPMVQAAYMSILGALSPDRSPMFFTRSLSLLRNFSLKSQNVVFFRAYALASLYRRPAAIEILQKPSTSEQLALRAYLDGDLAALPKLVGSIKSPIPKFLMQLAVNDLRWSYDYQSAQIMGTKDITDVPPAWKLFLTRRAGLQDPWDIPNTTDLKQFLDDAYPIRGYSVQDIARGMLVRGDLDSGDMVKIETSIHEHRNRMLKEKPEITASYAGYSITPLDILDFVSAWAENAALKNVNLRVSNQGLYEEGINLATKYEAFYKDHPEMSALKVVALKKLALQRQDAERKNLEQEASSLSHNACIWMLGQDRWANFVCSNIAYYENDFPRRAFWHIDHDLLMTGGGDRDEYRLRQVAVQKPSSLSEFTMKRQDNVLRDNELSLLYSIYDFGTLERYYNTLVSFKMEAEAEALLEKNKNRFNGNPGKAVFLAQQFAKKDDDKRIVRLYEDAILVTPQDWRLYYNLGMHYLRHADVREAKTTFHRFPLFQNSNKKNETDAADTVSLSVNAYRAGIALRWTGAVEDAQPFFRLSAGYQTGSASGMWSEYALALDDMDYQAAMQSMLSLGRRYSNDSAYINYLRLLSVTGHGSETEKMFLNLNMMDKADVSWSPVITSLRRVGKSDEEVRAWLAENGKGKVHRYESQLYYLWSLLVDRTPNPNLADMVENIERYVPLPEQQRASTTVKDQQGKELTSIPAIFASSRYLSIRKQYEKLFNLLDPCTGVSGRIEKNEGKSLLPYYAWSGAKTGRTAVVDKVLNKYKSENGRDFEFWLATAMMQAAEGNHKAALKSLELARTNMNSSFSDSPLVPSWYQLVESCELLFEDSQLAAYMDRTLDLARAYQRIQPLDSWAYAVEAKYAKTEEDQLRPLALALYLDRQSYHIEGISREQRDKALKWLDENNPFLHDAEHVQKNQI